MNTATVPAPLCSVAQRYTFHAIESSATLPGKYGAGARRMAILRVDRHEQPVGFVPKTIRAMRGVEIVREWDPCKPGKTMRSEYQQNKAALAEALAALTA